MSVKQSLVSLKSCLLLTHFYQNDQIVLSYFYDLDIRKKFLSYFYIFRVK